MSRSTAALLVRRGLTLGLGAGLAGAAWRSLNAAPPGGVQRWQRHNHRGEQVTLLEGPAMALATAGAAALAPGVPGRWRCAAAVAAAGAGGFGALDDLTEHLGGPSSKGLRGHLSQLARGRLTTGGAKVLGIGATGLAVAALGHGRRPGSALARAGDVLLDGALVAGCANLVNLFDLRPGRALKVVLLAAPAVPSPSPAGGLAAAAVGAGAALLPVDLAERAMLGDTGANAAGAVLGTAIASRLPRAGRGAALAGVVALTLASERVSFSRVIAATPGLRTLDALGRRPAGP